MVALGSDWGGIVVAAAVSSPQAAGTVCAMG